MAIIRDLESKLSHWMARRAIKKTGFRDWWSGLIGAGGSSATFAGASVNRLTYSQPTSSQSVNADLDGSLEILRARARALAANNEFAKHFLTLVASNIVGAAGPTLCVRAYEARLDPNGKARLDKSANDAIEIHWKRWSKSADITGKMPLAHLLRVAAKSVARDGETLIRKVRDRSLPYGFALQLLEADRLDVLLNKTLANGAKIRQGVEIDTTGRPIALWMRASHPGDREAAPSDYERVPIRDILHVFLPERAEQVRGYTWFHAVLMRSGQLQGFEESAVVAARVGASKIAALIPGEDAQGGAGEQMGDAKDSSGNFQINAEAGDLIQVPPGYDLKSWDPQYPHENYESFVNQCLRALAMGLDVATHNLSGNMREVNYSSARIAELSEREIWMTLQGWWIETVMEPIYREWLASALLLGQITFEVSGKALPADKLDKFAQAAQFRGRRWAWVDPEKEANASEKLISLSLASRTEIAASQGRDFEDIVDELEQERLLLEAAGLPSVAGKPEAQVPDPAATAAATGKAFADAFGAMKPAEVRVDAPITVNSPVSVQTPDVNNTVEAHFPEMSQEIIDKADAAEKKATETHEELARALEALAKSQADTARALQELRVGMVEKLEHVARGVYADRVPVFDINGDPVRSRLDLKEMH